MTEARIEHATNDQCVVRMSTKDTGRQGERSPNEYNVTENEYNVTENEYNVTEPETQKTQAGRPHSLWLADCSLRR